MKISTYVRNSDFDRFARLALKHGVTVSAVVRDRLLRRVAELEEPDGES